MSSDRLEGIILTFPSSGGIEKQHGMGEEGARPSVSGAGQVTAACSRSCSSSWRGRCALLDVMDRSLFSVRMSATNVRPSAST